MTNDSTTEASSKIFVVVTKIKNRWHARLIHEETVEDEMACELRQDIGWICREMLRWADKSFIQNRFTSASRERHNEDRQPVGRIWYQKSLLPCKNFG